MYNMLNDVEKKIFELRDKGYTPKQIREELGLTRSFVTYRLSKNFNDVIERRKAKHAIETEFEELVKKFVSKANSLNHLCSLLGLRGVEGYYVKIKKIIEANNLDTSHFGTLKKKNKNDTYNAISDEEYFSKGSDRKGTNLLRRLILHSYKSWKCENPKCGLTEWLGSRIPLQVHHINGDHYDNRLENLQLLCPNCHALTDNFCTKNSNKKIRVCLNCGKELLFNRYGKFCSLKCCGEYAHKKSEQEHEKLKESTITKKKRKKIVYSKFISGKLKDINRSDLIEILKKCGSFLQAGKYLNVSDNAVRKRCKVLDIPYMKKELNEFLMNN